MSSNENKYVQLFGKKDKNVRAWRMRVKLIIMSKLKIWDVFEKENNKFNEDVESARNNKLVGQQICEVFKFAWHYQDVGHTRIDCYGIEDGIELEEGNGGRNSDIHWEHGMWF